MERRTVGDRGQAAPLRPPGLVLGVVRCDAQSLVEGNTEHRLNVLRSGSV